MGAEQISYDAARAVVEAEIQRAEGSTCPSFVADRAGGIIAAGRMHGVGATVNAPKARRLTPRTPVATTQDLVESGLKEDDEVL